MTNKSQIDDINFSNFTIDSDEETFNLSSDSYEQETTIKNSKQTYSCITSNELYLYISELKKELSKVLEISLEKAEILIKLKKWKKKEFLIKEYISDEKLKKVINESSSTISKMNKAKKELECLICMDVIDIDKTICFSCNHHFCPYCWKDYITSKIYNTGINCILIKCPAYKCNTYLSEQFIRNIIPEKYFKKFIYFIIESLVNEDENLCWCQNNGCEYIIKRFDPNLMSLECICGKKFCFTCKKDTHDPASCKHIESWDKKCHNDSETVHWIMANTKRCPKCKVRIEKNHGCNHIICYSCTYEFCWSCMGDWKEHGSETGGFYKCNRYKEMKLENTKGNTGLDSAKKDLNKFLFYYQRYHNHDQSRKFAKKQAEQVDMKISKLRLSDKNSKWIDFQYLKQAHKVIINCREILKYTYIFGYYLRKGSEKDLFEFLQQQLETNTEKLHELSETDINKLDKQSIISYTNITQKFANNLLNGISEGLVNK